MTVRPGPSTFAFEPVLAAHQAKDVLRFISCGSVDDGKSTLIGRLLHDAQQLLDDQIATLAKDSRKYGTQGATPDFALLVDGLAAEREQGITIDVAYRFFSTEKRSFIVADTPGHEQYTRNMATGASTADLAILLVDARNGLTRQTRRHSLLLSMLGVRQVVLAVNKMDLVGWSQTRFEAIAREFAGFADTLHFRETVAIPMSALSGDNVVVPAVSTPWYKGPTLLAHLEGAQIERGRADEPFRMPVQWVNRPNPDFRGFSGLVTGGRLKPGDRVRIYPSGFETTVTGIVTFDGDLAEAVSGQSVTLTLADEIDVVRGDVIAEADRPPIVADTVVARLFWMADKPLNRDDRFLVKIGAQTVPARIAAINRRVDLDTLAPVAASSLGGNDVGDVTLLLDRPVAFDAYEDARATGGLILVDRESFDTLGMGLAASRDGHAPAGEGKRAGSGWLNPPGERAWRSVLKAVSWRVTGSLDTMLVAYLFTRDARISAAIGLTEVFTKLILYYGHERVWTRIRYGLVDPSSSGQDKAARRKGLFRKWGLKGKVLRSR